MFTIVLLILTADPTAFFQGYLLLPNPEPDDCIIVPLNNPKPSELVRQDPIITA